MQVLRQGTAVDVLIGPFFDLTDGVTEETGESPAVLLSKNGQALAAKNDATTPVHDASGYYNCELDTTDTTSFGTMTLVVANSGSARGIRQEYMVIQKNRYDTLWDSLSAINANMNQIEGNTSAARNLGAWTRTFGDSQGTTTGTTTTIIDTTLTEADDFWNSYAIVINVGTNIGYTGIVTDFDAASDTLTVFPAAPSVFDNTSQFLLMPCLVLSDLIAIDRDSTSVSNLKLQYNTTGLTGDTFPATQSTTNDIKTVTDKFVFTNTNEVDANTKSINDAEVVGDGNATPWDGA